MRRDLRVVDFGEGGDFFRFQEAADATQIQLEYVCRAGGEHPGEFVLGGQPFAGGDGDAGGAGNDGHLFRHLGGYGLLEPERIEGLQMLGQADGAGCRELTVGAEQQIRPLTHGLADQTCVDADRMQTTPPGDRI